MLSDAHPTTSIAYSNSIITSWNVSSEVDLATMKKMGGKLKTDMKVAIGGTDLILEGIKNKQTSKIMDAAGCIAGIVPESK